MDVRVRPLGSGDEVGWRTLWKGYCDFYEEEIPEEVTAATWERLHDPASHVAGLVAELDGDVVGIANYVVHPSTWATGDYCYLEDLFVSPQARGTGAGRALLNAMIAMRDANGWARVYWHTRESNATARRLYDRYVEADDFVRYVVR